MKRIGRLFCGTATRNQRGAISVFVALGLTVLLGSAAIAIDLGHLMNVRTESQRVADLAALAGAGAFVSAPGPNVAVAADAWAKQFAAQNEVNRQGVVLQSSDIQVDVANERVRVTVYNTQARGNPISTIFARILGINQVDVATTAVAQAWPSDGVTCVLPLFLVDKWKENNGAGGDPYYFDPAPVDPPDYYEAWDPDNFSPTATGYDEDDIGTEVLIKPGQGNQPGQPNDSWYYPFDAADVPGGANFRDAIRGCTDPDFVYTLGQYVKVETGVMNGPTVQGFKDLIDQDPNVSWDHDPAVNCIVPTSLVGAGSKANCTGSVRLRPAPMLDPRDTPPNGKHSVPISNFAGVFVDRVQGNNVYVVYAGYSGVIPAANPSGPTPPITKILRLVE